MTLEPSQQRTWLTKCARKFRRFLDQVHFALFSPLEPHQKRIALVMDSKLLSHLGLAALVVAALPWLGFEPAFRHQSPISLVVGVALIWLSFHILRYLPVSDARSKQKDIAEEK